MTHLVIVESPAKGKTIEKYLGKDYVVRASMGHIRDLPKKNMGIDIDGGFVPTYELSPDKKKTVSELKKVAKTADSVIIATDPDREGEAIGWHLCHALGLDAETTKRVVYQEITKTAVADAINAPRTLDMDLVNAQQARRLLDRIVGFEASPVLWKKVRKGLSAGRVQSVAVRLVVEREREIQKFIPKESWRLFARCHHGEDIFQIELAKIASKKAALKTRDDLVAVLDKLRLGVDSFEQKKDKKGNELLEGKHEIAFTLADIITKDSKRTPGAPFTTSTLQQEASRKMGFSVKQTMSVAQRLYQNGHITYMRTDSVNLSKVALAGCKQYIDAQFGTEYSLNDGRKYKTKASGAQEAHEAIRPTNFEHDPANCPLSGPEQKLYALIWNRTIASQMKEAKIQTTTYTFTPEVDQKQSWIAKGEVIVFPGFMKLYVE